MRARLRFSVETLASRHNPRLYTLVALLALGTDMTAWGQTCSLGNARHICIVGEGYTSRSNTALPRLSWLPSWSSRLSSNIPFPVAGAQAKLRVLKYLSEDPVDKYRPDRYGLSLAWSSIALQVGHISPALSRYSLKGATVLGGELNYQYRAVRLTTVAGWTQTRIRSRRVPTEEIDRRFPPGANRRHLYALRAGLFPRRWHVEVIGVVAKESATQIIDTNLVAPDPAHNVTLTLGGGVDNLPIFRGVALTADIQGTGSFLTIDNREASIPKIDVGAIKNRFARGLLSIGYDSLRTSSRVNFAVSGDVRVRWRQHAIGVFGEQVEPGFVSRGVASLRTDLRTIRVEPSTSFIQKRLRIAGSYTHTSNNLLNNQPASRQTYRWLLQPRITSPGFVLVGTFLRHVTRTSPQAELGSSRLKSISSRLDDLPDSVEVISARESYADLIDSLDTIASSRADLEQRFVLQTAMLSPTWRWGYPPSLSHKLTLTLASQAHSSHVVNTTQLSHVSFGVNYTVKRPTGLRVTGAANVLRDARRTPSVRRYNFKLGVGFQPTRGVTAGIDVRHAGSRRHCKPQDSRSDVIARQWELSGLASLVVPGNAGNVRINVRVLDNSADACSSFQARESFTELLTTLTYVYKF